MIKQISASYSQVEGTMELPTLLRTKQKLNSESKAEFGGIYIDAFSQIIPSEISTLGELYLDGSAIFRKEDNPYLGEHLFVI